VLANIGQETDAWGISRIPTYAAQAAHLMTAPSHRAGVVADWEEGLGRLMRTAEPGSDSQLTFTRMYAATASSPAAVDDVAGILSGAVVIDGLSVDQDLRWSLITSLARVGRFGENDIADELTRDTTISGKEEAAAARAARPDADAKAVAWQAAMLDASTPNETARSIAISFNRYDQDDVLAPYIDKYLDAVGDAWSNLGPHKAAVALEAMFPRVLASQDLLDRVDAWLETADVNPGARRYVVEGRADVARFLAAQARDAG
ncbi:MAG TPA: ERAP1-like C-terminal domain-containing protein, partial [Marmoricola sp.]